MRGELATSETYILAITQECRLCDVAGASAERMIRALTGEDCEVADLGRLDSDDLIEHGTATLTVSGHVYLPERFRRFDTTAANRNWYMLCGVLSATMLLENSFACIHGHPQYRTCADLVGEEVWRTSLFQVVEFTRILRRACRHWPGSRRLIAWGIQAAFRGEVAQGSTERLLIDAIDDTVDAPAIRHLRHVADDSINCFDRPRGLMNRGRGKCWPRALRLDFGNFHRSGFYRTSFFPSVPPIPRLTNLSLT